MSVDWIPDPGILNQMLSPSGMLRTFISSSGSTPNRSLHRFYLLDTRPGEKMVRKAVLLFEFHLCSSCHYRHSVQFCSHTVCNWCFSEAVSKFSSLQVPQWQEFFWTYHGEVWTVQISLCPLQTFFRNRPQLRNRFLVWVRKIPQLACQPAHLWTRAPLFSLTDQIMGGFSASLKDQSLISSRFHR